MQGNYLLFADFVLENEGYLKLLKRADVGTVWLAGYFYGCMCSSDEELLQARQSIESQGMDVGILMLPVNHPGNSLDPFDDSLDLRIPSHWRYRVNSRGDHDYYCADIEGNMLQDNAQAVDRVRQLGFRKIAMDDDLRLGNWGSAVQGCFCDACLTTFNSLANRSLTRETLGRILADRSDAELMRRWVDFHSGRVTRFLEAMDKPDTELLLMVMHFGDERHGIDLPAIRRSVPSCSFRVGESHFGDKEFSPPEGKVSELMGILSHLNLVPRETSYSETTVFPSRALHPANWVLKAKMAVAAGVPNLFFMGGTALIPEDYWEAWIDALPAVRHVASIVEGVERSFPIHVAFGTHGAYGEPLDPSPAPLLAGLPAKPLRGSDPDERGEMLLFFGDYVITPEWQRKLGLYQQIILDPAAAKRNPSLGGVPESARILHQDPHPVLLQQLIAQLHPAPKFPYLTESSSIALLWLEEIQAVLLLNLAPGVGENSCWLHFEGQRHRVVLQPHQCALVNFDDGTAKVFYW